MYESMQSPTDHSFQPESHPLPQPIPSTSRQSSEPLSNSSAGTSALSATPIVRIGPPSPTTDSFLNNPQQTTEWDNLPSSPPSPISPGRQAIHPASPPSPASTQNRARSQTVSKNFSRPFVATSNPPLPTSPSLESAQSSNPSVPYPLIQQSRPTTPRTDSLESASTPNPLDRKSSLGAGSSSLDHSGSSVGGHSMSASWEGRKMYGMKQHEEARRAITIAREQSQRGRMERDQGHADVEELKEEVPTRQRYASEEGAYGGEEDGEEESIHFPQSSQQQHSVSQEEETPYLAYAAPSSPTSSQPFPPDSAKSTFFEDFSTSAHSHASHPASFTFDPRPAPTPPIDYQPSVSLPLPIAGSVAPSMHRRPSDSPSFRSQHSPSPFPMTVPNILSLSAPASSSPLPSKQRNVLRKARPPRREEDTGSSAPMSRSGSALSSHSQTASTGESAGPWARFRSRSKSRSRAAASTFFDDPPPSPLPPTPQDSYFPEKPPLRHLTSSASLQPPRSEPLASPAFPSPSSTSPLSQADFARLQASRPAFLRAKTSTGNLGGSKEWTLKEVSGQKSVQTGLVHSGEAASVYGGDGEEMERLQDRVGNIGIGANPGGFGMNRSVSDQGPSTRPLQQQQQQSHDRTPSNGGNSLYSDYSIYSLPPSPANTSPTTTMNPMKFEPPSPEVSNGGLSRQSTLQKAKQTLGNGPMRGRMMRTPSGNERRADPVTPDDFLREYKEILQALAALSADSAGYFLPLTEIGIDHHEAGELERAAWCFEQSAKKDGGCGAGMLMYGLTLRHGWVSRRHGLILGSRA